MPKETFYRLPDEKRERIMAAAEREFLENSFEAASINRIKRGGDTKRKFLSVF